jgi:large subunit ribosomal protein L10
MALTKAKKNAKVAMLATELEHSTSAIIGTFKGLTASKDFELRKVVREAGGNYHVVKNKLAAKSSEGTKVEAALQGLKGVSSVAYTSGDPVALAKALSTWVKDNAEFTFKLGIVDGKVITVQEIQSLATLPGKEELFSKLLFLIQSNSLRARPSRRTERHRRRVKRRLRSRQRDRRTENRSSILREFRRSFVGCAVWAQRKPFEAAAT